MSATCTAASPLFTPDAIVREVKHLPSAPRVLPRLKRLLADANSSMAEIVAFIRLDPGIAARVLQAGNSAYFSKGTRCNTIDEAVNRVGYDQIYELVSYAVASQVLVRPLEVYGLDADDQWRRSVACALAAELLAERTHLDRESAYTIGLLHGIGMVVIDEWSLLQGRGLRFAAGGFPREAVDEERAALGCTHADVGAALLRDWEFSPELSEPVRLQYTPRSSAVHQRFASLLHAAKWVRSALCAEGARPAAPDAILLEPLRLSVAGLLAIIPEAERRLRAVSSLLELGGASESIRHRFPSARPRDRAG